MADLNLAARFLLELVGVGALAWWGWHLTESMPARLVAAIAAAGVLVVVWALVVAPKASNPLPQDLRMLIGTGLLLVAAAALAVAGEPAFAAAFAVLVVVNQLLLVLLGRNSA